MHIDQQQKIRALIPTASPEQLRAALEAVLSETSDQRQRDISDYGIDGSERSAEDVDAEYEVCNRVSDAVDASVLAALATEPRARA